MKIERIIQETLSFAFLISYNTKQKTKCSRKIVSSDRNVTFAKKCSIKSLKLEKNCVKSVQIRSFFWSIVSCIQSEYRKIRTSKNSVSGYFLRSESFLLTVFGPAEVGLIPIYLSQSCSDKEKNIFQISLNRVTLLFLNLHILLFILVVAKKPKCIVDSYHL